MLIPGSKDCWLHEKSLRNVIRPIFLAFWFPIAATGVNLWSATLLRSAKLRFTDSLFLNSFNRGTALTVKHGAQKQKCLKKRDFFKLLFREQINIQPNVKEKTWEYLLDRLMLGWKCNELENNSYFVVHWPCLQMCAEERLVWMTKKPSIFISLVKE